MISPIDPNYVVYNCKTCNTEKKDSIRCVTYQSIKNFSSDVIRKESDKDSFGSLSHIHLFHKSISICLNHNHPTSATMMELFTRALYKKDFSKARAMIDSLEACSTRIVAEKCTYHYTESESRMQQEADLIAKNVADDTQLKDTFLGLYHKVRMESLGEVQDNVDSPCFQKEIEIIPSAPPICAYPVASEVSIVQNVNAELRKRK